MFTVSEILKATEGKLLQGNPGAEVKGVFIDSRNIEPNELFIAIKGENFDGHDFVSKVAERGIKVIVVHRTVKIENRDVAVIRVRDTVKALGALARFHRLRFDIPVVGLTGSAGKTTTKEMLAAVLKSKFHVLYNAGTQNNHIGVPLTLLKLTKQHDIAVIEMGTNQPGDISWLADVARPTIAVLTNIGESHLEKLKTLGGVFQEKWALAKAVPARGYVIYNKDDRYLKMIPQKKLAARAVAYSIVSLSACRATHVSIRSAGLSFKIHKKTFFLKTFSTDMAYNALAAVACARIFKITDQNVYRAFKTFRFDKGRQEILKVNGNWIINDSYNANPVSMRNAIATLEAFPTEGRRILISADMLELGNRARVLHEEVGRRVGSSGIDILMTVGVNARWIARAALRTQPGFSAFHDRDVEALKHRLRNMPFENDVILVKGSRGMKMENVVEFLKENLKR